MLTASSYFDFGKYCSMQVREVMGRDPQYIFWLISNTDVRFTPRVIRNTYAYMQEIDKLPQNRNSIPSKIRRLLI